MLANGNYGQRTIQDVRNEIGAWRAEKPPISWDKIGQYYGLKGGHVWKIFNEGYEPIRLDIRSALGLSAMASIIVINGSDIPSGSQILYASFCPCGRAYISNHPLRKRCFLCSPYRGKK